MKSDWDGDRTASTEAGSFEWLRRCRCRRAGCTDTAMLLTRIVEGCKSLGSLLPGVPLLIFGWQLVD